MYMSEYNHDIFLKCTQNAFHMYMSEYNHDIFLKCTTECISYVHVEYNHDIFLKCTQNAFHMYMSEYNHDIFLKCTTEYISLTALSTIAEIFLLNFSDFYVRISAVLNKYHHNHPRLTCPRLVLPSGLVTRSAE